MINCKLPIDQNNVLSDVIKNFPHIFNDVLSQTILFTHDIDVGDALPIKQHPYRVNPEIG
jgi:hypothetical protein